MYLTTPYAAVLKITRETHSSSVRRILRGHLDLRKILAFPVLAALSLSAVSKTNAQSAPVKTTTLESRRIVARSASLIVIATQTSYGARKANASIPAMAHVEPTLTAKCCTENLYAHVYRDFRETHSPVAFRLSSRLLPSRSRNH